MVEEVPAEQRVDGVDVLHRPAETEASDVLLVAIGTFGELAVAAAERLAAQGIGVTVVDPRWVYPVSATLPALARRHGLVVTVEDSGRHGGFGSALATALRDADVEVPLRDLAVPNEFPEHGSRDEILAALGLTEQDVARRVTEWVADRVGEVEPLSLAVDGDQSGTAAG